MKLSLVKGTTSKIVHIFIQNSAVSTGAGLTGLVYNSASLVAYYFRPGDSTATAIPLVTATLGTFTSGGFKEVDATNMPGVYELGIPNAALATGANQVVVMLKGATNMAPVLLEIELTAWDNQNATSGGMSKFADIETDTADIQSRIPAALSGGNMKCDVFAMQTDSITNAAFQASAISATKIASDAISGSKLSTSAIDKISDGVWDEVMSGHVTAGTSGRYLDAQVSNVEADTQDIQSRIPAALVSGRIDASVGAMAANVITAASTAADVVTELQDGIATAANLAVVAGYLDTEIAAIKAKTDNLPTDPADASDIAALLTLIHDFIDTEVAAIKAKTDNLPASPAATGDIPSAATIASAVLDKALSSHTTAGTLGAQVTLIRRILQNRIEHSGTTITLYADDGTTPLLTCQAKNDGGTAINSSSYAATTPAERTALA